MISTALDVVITAPVPTVRPAPLDRLPGSVTDDPFVRLMLGWVVGHPANTAKAYRRDLESWAEWCAQLGVHPLSAERHHVDLWVRYLTTVPRPRTGRPASAATVSRKLSALAGFYDYGILDAEVLTHSPVAAVRRPKVADESHAVGLTGDELKRLLAAANAHSLRSAALVALLVFTGLRISEVLGADVRDYSHDAGHRVLKVKRKGGKAGRVALVPAVVRALDAYLDGRTTGPIFLASAGPRRERNEHGHFLRGDSTAVVDEATRYPYGSAYGQLTRLCASAKLPAGVTPHSLRHSFATEALHLGAALQDVQDALGHADPRTTRRYDRNRNRLDRSPNYLLAGALTDSPAGDRPS
jgi:integrase/recombinase XerD